VRSGASAVCEIEMAGGGTRFGTDFYPLGRKPLAAAGLWRHLADYGRSAIAAATFALQDAGVRTHGPGREDIGLVFATSYGPVSVAIELGTGMDSPEGASALSFANATVNAAAGAVCQALVMRGPTTTISTGGASALVALDTAMHLLRTGHATRIMLLAIDEVCDVLATERGKNDPMAPGGVVRPYDADRQGLALGAASVALLLESASAVRARGGTAYATVHGVCWPGPVRTSAMSGSSQAPAAGPSVMSRNCRRSAACSAPTPSSRHRRR
jgi:3-oxoacyl-[acyl-carrier-protein] synthase II